VKHLLLLLLGVIAVAGCSNAAGLAFDATPPIWVTQAVMHGSQFLDQVIRG
jgi:hypothetical protein